MTHPESGPRRRSRRPRDPRATHERIVRAALDLFASKGYHASTTPAIAARAGVAEGTIYRHFESKEQLLNDIYRGGVRLLSDAIAATPGALTCEERLRRIAERWLEVAGQEPALVMLMFAMGLDPQLDARSRGSFASLREELTKVIAAGKAEGSVRSGPVEVWTDVWFTLATFALKQRASGVWGAQHEAPGQVVAAAWDAIREQRPR